MEPKQQERRSFVAVTATALGLLIIFIVLAAYQLYRSETGRSSWLPPTLRHFIASRDLQAAKSAQYESIRLRDYMKVASLDGNDFPEAWLYLCDFYSKNSQWAAARFSCERAVELSGATPGTLGKLGSVHENLRAYATAGEAYARAADLNPADPNLRERAVWMFLAAHNYDRAVASASKLVAYDRNVDEKKAHAILAFAYAHLGNKAQADTAYAISFPDVRQSSCSLESDNDGRWALVCSGVATKNGRRVLDCVGTSCP
jgi:tetratricopeptide (TPR) repeat protein